MDGVLNRKKTVFGWKKFFGHVVSCDIADVFPIAFAQSVLALSPAGGSRDLGVRFKELVNGPMRRKSLLAIISFGNLPMI